MIFHIPMQIKFDVYSGSQIRPQKMIQAFKDIGYDVELVMGNCTKRKAQIKQIKKNIKSGIKYDFVYSESSTYPTLFTEKNHFSKCLFLDFNFFKFCKKNYINVGLFYRDVYWAFNEYIEYKSILKKYIFKTLYIFDLIQYKKFVDILYLPSLKMSKYLPIRFNKEISSLPPAESNSIMDNNKRLNKRLNKKLIFIYVGGLSDLYDLTLFSKGISHLDNIEFNLCTREKEWLLNKENYSGMKNIFIHHKGPDQLSNIYAKSDIAVYFIKNSVLWEFAMGIKLFEYMSYRKPIIAVKNTAVGDYVERNDIGWVIGYDENELNELIEYLQNNLESIDEKIKNIEKIIPENTWESRAMKVMSDLR